MALSNCLICLTNCSKSSSSDDQYNAKKLNIPGAGNCLLLNKQLEQLFIVQKLLDIPRRKCQEFLIEQLKISNDDGVKGDIKVFDGNGSSAAGGLWFFVCDECTRMCVEPAWNAYQKLLTAEAKIRKIKGKIKERMREEILKRNMKKEGAQSFVREGVDNEIRKFIFSDLLGDSCGKKVKVEQVGDIEEVLSKRPRPSYRLDEVDTFLNVNSPSRSEDPPDDDKQRDADWELLPSTLDDNFDDGDDLFPVSETPVVRSRSKGYKKVIMRTTTSTTATPAVPRLIRRLKKRKRKPRAPETLKRFKCMECGCYFHTPEQLSNHLEAHEQSKQNGGGPYDCDKCSYPAKTPLELQFHLKNRHGRVRFHNCPKCGKRGKSWKHMKAHLISAHADEITQEDMENPEISLKCHVCDRQFERLESFVIHKRKMHPELFGAESDQPVECATCGRKFMSTIRLEHHILNEHTEKPSKYVCDECGKGFKFKCRLDDHMAVHWNKVKREYVCHICGVDYAHQTILTKHYRTVHPGETEAGGVKKELNPGDGSTSTPAEEQFKCRHCELTSPFQAVIKRHLKTHKEESGNKCEQCGNCYMTEQSLKRHIRLNHPLVRETVPCPHCLKPFPNADYMKDHVSKFCKVKQTSKSEFTLALQRNSTNPEERLKKENPADPLPLHHDQYVSMEVVDVKMIFP